MRLSCAPRGGRGTLVAMAFGMPLWSRDGRGYARAERFLLGIFLFSRAVLALRTFDDGVGWDAGDHLEMLDHWPWEEEVWSVRSRFYAFHPPLGFFLGRVLVVLGIHRDAAAQTVAAVAMLLAFFAIRFVLRRLGVLHSMRGLVMLYGGASLPVQIYLAHSINLDALLQAAAAGIIAVTIVLRERRSWWGVAALTLLLAAAVLTKATGVALFAIPAVVLLCLEPEIRRMDLRRAVAIAVVPVIAAIVLVAPYFLARYVVPEGRLFITNMDMEEYDLPLLQDDRAVLRERGNMTLWKDLFWGVTPGSEPLDMRDARSIRLANGWKDLWAANRANIPQAGLSFALSAFYAWVGTALLLLGALRCVRDAATASTWARMGRALGIIAALHGVMLLTFFARYPHPLGNPMKAIYVAPALLFLWYLLGAAVPREWHRPLLLPVVLLALWTLCNAALPVY